MLEPKQDCLPQGHLPQDTSPWTATVPIYLYLHWQYLLTIKQVKPSLMKQGPEGVYDQILFHNVGFYLPSLRFAIWYSHLPIITINSLECIIGDGNVEAE
jgi:hypothetical protein